jgi:spore coat polysaccharide biosynthesis predicted glycosyltransferase SpsG
MIWLCFDIGPRVGMGHAVRCRSLARALKDQTIPCGFGSSAPDHLFCQSLVENDFEIRDRDALPPGNVLLDLSYPDFAPHLPALIGKYQSEGRKIALIDGLGDEAYTHGPKVDQVITPYFMSATDPQRSAKTHLCGAEYALLDPVYGEAPPSQRGRGTLLISIGGSDPWCLTEKIIDNLQTELKPLLVVGGLFAPERVERLKASMTHLNGETIQDPNGLRDLMTDTDIAILGPGLSKYEAAACNLPTVLMAPDETQQSFNAPFESAGLGVLIAHDSTDMESDLSAAIKAAKSLMPLDGRAQIDGLGAHRVAEALAGLTD